jgi:hypothetical protein
MDWTEEENEAIANNEYWRKNASRTGHQHYYASH